MIYIIYNISNTASQKIQADLLEYSIVKSKQVGQVIQIQSLDGDLDFKSSTGLTYKFDSSLRFSLGITQQTFNGLYTFHKIFDSHKFEDDDLLFFVDPDMIFERSVDLNNKIDVGEIWGQRWMGFDQNWCKLLNIEFCPEESMMYPWLIRAGDARKIKHYILEYGIKVYTDYMKNSNVPETVRWMMDMYVFTSSYEYGGLKSKLEDNLSLCSGQYTEGSDPSMLHYCQFIKDKHGSILWNKGRSELSKFLELPDLGSVTNEFDRRLVNYLMNYKLKYNYK